MALERTGGILLHPTSLPGGHGCGDFGPAAEEFIDYLSRARVMSWQVLPLGPTGREGSPYQARSSFAGNPLLISLERLAEAGFLRTEEAGEAPFADGTRIDFAAVRAYKDGLLRRAYANFFDAAGKAAAQESFTKFCREQTDWLEDYALFAALKVHFSEEAWWHWPDTGLRAREAGALENWRKKLADEIRYQQWLQFAFYVQWGELKRRANRRGIRIIGDIPIYAAHDSADVWAAQEFFALDPASGEAELLAGAPPDYFCEDGQLWGNPIYRWERLKADGYKWWLARMRAALRLTDVVRIDHFLGFEAYWQTPAGERTARNGKWIKGPGQDFFSALRREFGDNLPLIAEDLGVITPEVDKLRTDNGLPGMKILQFAFCDGANAYRPHSYEKNCVVYTGTHDNDTTRGWYAASGADYAHMNRETIERERDLCRRYLAVDGSNIHWDMIRLALASVADTAIVPMQDVLGLGNEARMNIPGTAEGCWGWRLSRAQLAGAEAGYLAQMCEIFDRVPKTADAK